MAIQKKSEGFGDSIAKVTHATGLDKLADKMAKAMGKKDCGCGARQKSLNNPNLLVNKMFYKPAQQNQVPRHKQIKGNENNPEQTS